MDRTLEDVDALRPHLLRLLSPRDTVMDLNIGAALWMATEAEGVVYKESVPLVSHIVPADRSHKARGVAREAPVIVGGASALIGAGRAPAHAGAAPAHEAGSGANRNGAAGALHRLAAANSAVQDKGAAASGTCWGKPQSAHALQHFVNGEETRQPRYKSAARVVLLGHGADELCGGWVIISAAFHHFFALPQRTCLANCGVLFAPS